MQEKRKEKHRKNVNKSKSPMLRDMYNASAIGPVVRLPFRSRSSRHGVSNPRPSLCECVSIVPYFLLGKVWNESFLVDFFVFFFDFVVCFLVFRGRGSFD